MIISDLCLFFFFFFSSRRRHTRCLSDWSSDVCSSDLATASSSRVDPSSVSEKGSGVGDAARHRGGGGGDRTREEGSAALALPAFEVAVAGADGVLTRRDFVARSEERRVGEECSARWSV